MYLLFLPLALVAEVVGTIAGFGSSTIALAVDATRLPVYLQADFLPAQLYWLLPLIAGTAFLGSFIGKQIAGKIPQANFRRVVLATLAAIGLTFVKSFF